MAYISYIVRLINSDPVFHFVAKTAEDEAGVVPKSCNNCDIFPATIILQSLRKVPVVQRDLTKKLIQ